MAGRSTVRHADDTVQQLPPFSIFDLRTWIAVMFGVFGALLATYGLFWVTDEDLAKAAGLNLNLWTGLACLVVALFFAFRTYMAPQIITESVECRTLAHHPEAGRTERGEGNRRCTGTEKVQNNQQKTSRDDGKPQGGRSHNQGANTAQGNQRNGEGV
ncbi:hypothetical protein R6G85_00595 [Actinotignum urinale]|uniref:Uncharacterized protein n=1 Tax=Actinotignum urinale TaxID=190146 RepID=A0AAW9HUT9_9ACTO|nr:hypothetical protein [Actinotignum urinale]MDY5129023.1 hypothetical protein [Actinotignum urinale]MDY5132422.1 hypothetical protein [Actinotignum urinale]MDY5150991.1 hypothetical protein [Actinotignum urinale]MDY5154823.1 hypothetical protein [Actinotignum urinale]MDY5159884.1 hypothetical protein [Actinotignum urinale]